MTTRINRPKTSNAIDTGYEPADSPSDLAIPSCGIEDVDTAVFNLFDKELQLSVMSGDKETRASVKVPVIFAAGEKWALLKKGRPLRDQSDTLILPLVTIARTAVQASRGEDMTTRGINQQTGVITIKRRLDKTDRNYQNLINSLLLKNQKNVATPTPPPDGVSTSRNVGELSTDPDVAAGALLKADRRNNVHEYITIPSPIFFTAKYEVTFWTQYTEHMNQVIETFMSSFLPQGHFFKVTTSKGYWFVANVDDTYTYDTNFNEMSNAERLIKTKINLTVPAYLLPATLPGGQISVKRHVSSPSISFDVKTFGEASPYPFRGADDPTLPLSTNPFFPGRTDARDDGTAFLGVEGYTTDPSNPGTGNYLTIGQSVVKVAATSSYNGEALLKLVIGSIDLLS